MEKPHKSHNVRLLQNNRIENPMAEKQNLGAVKRNILGTKEEDQVGRKHNENIKNNEECFFCFLSPINFFFCQEHNRNTL